MPGSRIGRWLVAGVILAGGVGLSTLSTAIGSTPAERGMVHQNDRAEAASERVRPGLETDLRALGLQFGSPVFMRIFKREKELELWIEGKEGRFALFRTYPICAYSGELGPKQRQGDNQAPEGFYRVSAGQLNPQSRFHLAFNLGYPNAYDRARARTGDFLMVHGSCVSIGCYAMGDGGIEEIYTLAAAALNNGQNGFEVHAFPFRPDHAALDHERHSAWFAFWGELAPAYEAFEQTRKPPRISVDGLHYAIVARP